jgi:hypothetical protein
MELGTLRDIDFCCIPHTSTYIVSSVLLYRIIHLHLIHLLSMVHSGHGMSIGYFRHPGYDAVDLERVTNFTTCLLYIHLYILQLI